jgi:capsular exopolysaccharide synthesis family protein
MEFQQRIDQLMIDRDAKLQYLGPKNHEIVALDQTIDRYKAMIAKLYEPVAGEGTAEDSQPITDEEFLQAYVNDLSLKYSEVVSQIPGLIEDLNFHYRRAELLSEISRQLADADEEVQMFRKFLEETVATLTQINPRYIEQGYVKNDNEGFLFIRLNQPSLGERVWPDLLIILSLGGFLGSMLGFGLAYLVELSDKTFHNPDEIMKQLSMPLIGHIPVIQQSKRHIIENSFIDPSICVYHRPKSQASEAFRAIRTALFFSTKGKTNSVIQVTSPTPGDGKSTIAANLAVSIAQSGKRVLLLDADMRRPSIHHAFGIKTQEGFPQVLLGEKTWRAAIYECEEVPGLSILPCGAKPANPAELISTPRVGELLEEMRQHFDFIVMDTPPVLAVTDPCPVAARVDGVILTIRIKKNVKISSDRATEILNSVGANLIGVVVNGVGNQSGYGSQYSYGAYRAGYQYNGYGYGYGYSYGYGKRGEDEKPVRPATVRNLQAPQSSDAGVSP